MSDRWTFVEHDQSLVGDGRVVRLRPKAAAVLGCLLRRKGRLASHAEILTEVWQGIEVSPDLVREYVFDLRAALDDDARKPRFIETVRGRGVRLIGDIEFEVCSSPQTRRPTLRIDRPSVGNLALAGWAETLWERLTSCLAVMRDIAVADALDCDAPFEAANYVLKTHLSRHGGRVEASFFLVDRASGETVWAERLGAQRQPSMDLAQEFSLRISNAVGSWRGTMMQLEAAKARQEPAGSLSAYQRYILALALERQRDPGSTAEAVRHLERSLELDPGNARGWLLLWYMLERPFVLFGEPFTDAARAGCRAAIERAYALAPDDPHVLINVCGERAREGDIVGAELALDLAATKGHADADVMSRCANAYAYIVGDATAAREHLARAHRLNPALREWLRFTTIRVAFFAGDFATSRRLTPHSPRLLPYALFRSLSLAMEGMREEAREVWDYTRLTFPAATFEAYAARLPIAAEAPRAMFYDAARRL